MSTADSPAIAASLSMGPMLIADLSSANNAPALALRSAVAAAAGLSLDVVYLASAFQFSSGSSTTFSDTDSVNTVGSEGAADGGATPQSRTLRSERRRRLVATPSPQSGDAGSKRSVSLEGIPPSENLKMDPENSGISVTVVIVPLDSSYNIDSASAALRREAAKGGPDGLGLAANALAAVAASKNMPYPGNFSSSFDAASVRTISVKTKTTYWGAWYAWAMGVYNSLPPGVIAGITLAVLVCVCGAGYALVRSHFKRKYAGAKVEPAPTSALEGSSVAAVAAGDTIITAGDAAAASIVVDSKRSSHDDELDAAESRRLAAEEEAMELRAKVYAMEKSLASGSENPRVRSRSNNSGRRKRSKKIQPALDLAESVASNTGANLSSSNIDAVAIQDAGAETRKEEGSPTAADGAQAMDSLDTFAQLDKPAPAPLSGTGALLARSNAVGARAQGLGLPVKGLQLKTKLKGAGYAAMAMRSPASRRPPLTGRALDAKPKEDAALE